MNRALLFCVVVVFAGCSTRQDSVLSNECLLPPMGTPIKQIESVYGEAQQVLPPNLKQPEELHVYNILPRLLLRVNYNNSKNVIWSQFLHLDAKYHPISAKPESLTPEVIEHDRMVKERDLNELSKKIRKVPWGT